MLIYSTGIRTLHFFASIGSMDPLTVKQNHMINPQKNEVYYVILSKCIISFITIAPENCT